MKRVNALNLMLNEDISELARLLHTCFSGSSYKNLVISFPQFDVGQSELSRWVNSLVHVVYGYVDGSFEGGWVLGDRLANVSTELETDEKELSTVPNSNLGIYRTKFKHGRLVNSVSLAGVYEQGVAAFCYVQATAGRQSTKDFMEIRAKLVHRYGPGITKLQHDNHASYAEADDQVFGEGVGTSKRHIGKASPNRIAEGNNKGLNRNFGSGIQSQARQRGRWLHYDWAEPYQDNNHPEFTGWTRFEIVIGRRLGVNGWEYLLRRTLDALQRGEIRLELLSSEDEKTREDPWECMKRLLSRQHELIFEKSEGGTVYCRACDRNLASLETSNRHIHEFRRIDDSLQVDLIRVREGSSRVIAQLQGRQRPGESPELGRVLQALASINENENVAVFAWCSGVKSDCPWVALVFSDSTHRKMHVQRLKRRYRVQKAGPAGMATLRSNYPETKPREIWIVSPFNRQKATGVNSVVGYWKDWQNTLSHSRVRRAKSSARDQVRNNLRNLSRAFLGASSLLDSLVGKV